MSHRARLFVISGPSGAGKGTLVSRIRERRSDLALSISATTRAPRSGEQQGVHYWFYPVEEFERMIDADCFVEWALVHENYYGTLRDEVEQKLSNNTSVILEIDPQGALQVKANNPDAYLIFIDPPSMEVLAERLALRGTEDAQTQSVRLANAVRERALIPEYDAVVVNDNLDQATHDLLAVIEGACTRHA